MTTATATSVSRSTPTTNSDYAGTGHLLRLAWRRDRVLIPVGVLAITAFAVGSAKATLALYPTAESMGGAISQIFSSPAATAIYGPISDATDPDALAVVKTTMFGAVLLAIFAYAVVRRHTRSEEEDGRFELVAGGVVGRRAPLVAAVLISTLAVLVTCLLTGAGYASLGMDAAGSWASAAGWAATALSFVGITAVAAQLSSTARGCAGIAMGALGAAFLVRAVADSSASAPGWLGWLSPVGWTTKADAFAADRWWVVFLGIGLLLGCVAAAFALLERRDLGAGLMPARRGPAHAPASLGSATGLAWRLGRTGLLGWGIGFAIGGMVVGGLAKSAMDMIKDPAIADLLRKMGGGEGLLVDVYVTTELGFIAIIAAAYGITAILRWRSEETRGHSEVVLATATSRTRYAVSQLAIALLGSLVLMVLLGLFLGLADAGNGGTVGGLGRVLPAALVRVPAIWVCVCVAVLAVGLFPRWAAAIGWGALAVVLVVGEFGALMGLPDWMQRISPFAHVPKMPVEAFAWTPVVALLVIAALLVGAGFAGFRRRDIG